jgi:hypothetical protein
VDFSHGNPNHEDSLRQLVETFQRWNRGRPGRAPLADPDLHRPTGRPTPEPHTTTYQRPARGRALQLEPWQYAVLLGGAGLLLAILLYFGYFSARAKSRFPLHSQVVLAAVMATAEVLYGSGPAAETLPDEGHSSHVPMVGETTAEAEVDRTRAAWLRAIVFRSGRGQYRHLLWPLSATCNLFLPASLEHRRLVLLHL